MIRAKFELKPTIENEKVHLNRILRVPESKKNIL